MTGRLAESAFAVPALTNAWQEVLANDRDDGVLSPGVARFEADQDDRVARLADDLAAGSWEPGPLTPVPLRQGDKVRELHIPRVEDRVVARAILDAVAHLVDPWLGPASFAYRTGRGVADAVREVAVLRAEGLPYVVRTDIKDCFPTLPRDLAVRRFGALVGDEAITRVVRMLSQRPVQGDWRIAPGVPLGCPLSPLLANLVLVDVDDDLLAEGFPTVRYADDLAIFAPSQRGAHEALRVTHRAVEELGMSLNADNTEVMDFETGFRFLGEEFNVRYPPLIDRTEVPDQRSLYVSCDGGRVTVWQGRLRVFSEDDSELLDIPQTQVSRIVCFGSVGLSSGVRTWALANDVDVVLASRSGNYLGTMLSHEDRYRPARLRAQIAACDSPKALVIGRAIVDAKVRKQRVLLQRANRRHTVEQTRDAIHDLDSLLAMVPEAQTTEELMGLEGAAAAAYFPCLGALMPEELRFRVRSRRPPMDVANAALSLLYTILLGECITALHGVGLDPSLGLLHSDQDNRPSLALDLMEEFRPLIVDNCVQGLAATGGLTSAHGRTEGNGVLLTQAGREAVLDAYERRMLQPTSALAGFSGTIRRHLYRQAQRLRLAIMTDIEFTGLSWR